jgi:integrase
VSRTLPKDDDVASRREKGSGSVPKWNAAKQRWQVNITVDGQRKTLTHKTSQRELELARDRELAAAAAGEPSPTDRRTLGEFLDRWIESIRVASLHGKPKRQTYRSYEGHVRVHLRPGLGDEPLARLSVDRVQRFFDEKLAEGHSPSNMARVRATLRIALGRAERQKLVPRNVAKLVEISVPDNDRVGKALDGEQVQALLAAAESERHGPLLAFLVATGLRLGEGRALRWRDVDERRGQLRVRHTLEQIPGEPWQLVPPKSRPSKDRLVPLVPLALDVLRQQRDRQEFERRRGRDAWVGRELVFANEVGDVVGQRGVEDAMKRSLERAGLDLETRVHDLRHSACTYLIAIGLPLPTVQAIMGHSTLVMTQRYAHVQDAMLDDAKARMSAFFATLGQPAAAR